MRPTSAAKLIHDCWICLATAAFTGMGSGHVSGLVAAPSAQRSLCGRLAQAQMLCCPCRWLSLPSPAVNMFYRMKKVEVSRHQQRQATCPSHQVSTCSPIPLRQATAYPLQRRRRGNEGETAAEPREEALVLPAHIAALQPKVRRRFKQDTDYMACDGRCHTLQAVGRQWIGKQWQRLCTNSKKSGDLWVLERT